MQAKTSYVGVASYEFSPPLENYIYTDVDLFLCVYFIIIINVGSPPLVENIQLIVSVNVAQSNCIISKMILEIWALRRPYF